MGWIIFADILLIIIVALCLSVSVSVRIDEDIRIKVKYAGITIFSVSPEDDAKKKAKAEKKNRKKKSENDVKESAVCNNPESKSSPAAENTQKSSAPAAANKDKPSAEENPSDQSGASKSTGKDSSEKSQKKAKKSGGLSIDSEMIKTLIESAGRPAKRLFSHIRVTDLFLDITASGDDAAAAALNYGKINWLVHSAIAFLYQTVRLYVKKINIGVDFTSGNTEYFISCKIKMRLCTAIGCALWFFVRAAKLTLKKTKSDITGGNPLRQSVTEAAKKGT